MTMRTYATHTAPVKPGIPILLVLALALWASCASAFTLLEDATRTVMLVLAVVFVLVAIVTGIFMALSRKKHLCALILGVALGISCASVGALSLSAAQMSVPDDAQEWVFTLSEDAATASHGSKATALATTETGESRRVQVYFNAGSDKLCGDAVSARVKFSGVPESSKSYYWSQGISAVAYLDDVEDVQSDALSFLRSLRRQAIEAFGTYGGEQAGILQALACGYRVTINETGEYNDFKVLGLAHLVAVSGAHLTIVTMVLEWLLRACRAPRMFRLVLLSAFVLAYLVFAGIPISAIRAAFMVLLSFASTIAGRRAASLNALALCIIVFIVIDPAVSVSASFFLSAGSTLGIILFAGLITSWLRKLPHILERVIAEPIGLTVSSSLVAQPYSAALFSQLPLLSIPANILAGPFFTLGCVAGLLAAVLACAFPGGATYIIGAATLCVMPLDFLVSLLASLPFVCLPIDLPVVPMVLLSVALCLALWLTWPQNGLRLLGGALATEAAALLIAVVIAPRFAGDEIIMLDVGQGDAFVVRSGSSAIMIDVGTQDSMLRSALGREGIYSLDAIVISHSDDDHYGSLSSLAGIVDVKSVYVAQDALTCGCDSCEAMLAQAASLVGKDAVYGLSVGDVIRVGDFDLEVLWPQYYTDEGENADSLCLNATVDVDRDGIVDWTALFTGDAESDQLQQLEDDGLISTTDVLKVGHHGSKVSLSAELAESLNPRIALISVGANNRYGHPREETLTYLSDVDALILRTDERGDVKLTFSANAIDVS